MKVKIISIVLIIFVIILLIGCSSTKPIDDQIETMTLSPITATIMATNTQRITAPIEILPSSTPRPTLNPRLANERIAILLQDPIDCDAPCFWGIVPERTTRYEAQEIFSRYGLEAQTIEHNGSLFDYYYYEFPDGLRISANLKSSDDIIQNIQLSITPEPQKMNGSRKWSVFSPETLITRYGTPSKVEIIIDPGGSQLLFSLLLYFDDYDMVIDYTSYNTVHETSSGWEVCPLMNQQDDVSIWMGSNFDHLPIPGVPLEKATSLSYDEFVSLMTGNPEEACLPIIAEEFRLYK